MLDVAERVEIHGDSTVTQIIRCVQLLQSAIVYKDEKWHDMDGFPLVPRLWPRVDWFGVRSKLCQHASKLQRTTSSVLSHVVNRAAHATVFNV
jgi:hypothetical protein